MDKPKSFIKKNFRNHSCPGLALSRCSCIGPCALVLLRRLFIFAKGAARGGAEGAQAPPLAIRILMFIS